ncbi:COG3650 family protein [Octadecabacter ascidiaceicola]|uniref:Bacterial SH3 domain protein n=1 Tax=Octadecabacter ascidiaceicola TaxID=1655543 RepID=A0A238KEV9_9RHOB|nr:SH3 domain-containing protein [Octadecabacter ascidiaceicola]SMX41375.1 Bacterial SH3 domain protein [Octadecabacter ascidiaceicola]
MILLLGFFFFVLYGLASDAQTLPSLYEVEGVPSGEHLNVREGPSVSTDIVEVISNTNVVEVLWTKDGWGQIGAGEISGWVSMNYLTAVPHLESLPILPVSCYGTEPFWSVTVEQGIALYSTPETPAQPMTVETSAPATNGFSFLLSDADNTHTLVARANTCSDGMSERLFGISALMHIQTDEGNYVYQGCCTFQTE